MDFVNHIKNEHIRIRNEVNNNEIYIDGDIGASLFTDGYDFARFKADVSKIEGDISINIKSYGGDLDEALAIHDYIRSIDNHVTTKVIGATASAGTVISFAGDKRLISANSRYLIHKPMVGVMGNSDDFKRILDQLESLDRQLVNLYTGRNKLTAEQTLELMIKEEFITAKKALEYGFVDEIIEEKTQKKVTNQTNEGMSKKLFDALKVDNEEKGLEVLNDLQAKVKKLADKDVELTILNEEKEEKEEEIEELKAEIAKLKEQLKNKEVEESEKEAEEIENMLNEAVQNKKIAAEAKNELQAYGEEKGAKKLAKLLNSIPEPKKVPLHQVPAGATSYANLAELKNAFKAGKLTAKEYADGLKLFN